MRGDSASVSSSGRMGRVEERRESERIALWVSVPLTRRCMQRSDGWSSSCSSYILSPPLPHPTSRLLGSRCHCPSASGDATEEWRSGGSLPRGVGQSSSLVCRNHHARRCTSESEWMCDGGMDRCGDAAGGVRSRATLQPTTAADRSLWRTNSVLPIQRRRFDAAEEYGAVYVSDPLCNSLSILSWPSAASLEGGSGRNGCLSQLGAMWLLSEVRCCRAMRIEIAHIPVDVCCDAVNIARVSHTSPLQPTFPSQPQPCKRGVDAAAWRLQLAWQAWAQCTAAAAASWSLGCRPWQRAPSAHRHRAQQCSRLHIDLCIRVLCGPLRSRLSPPVPPLLLSLLQLHRSLPMPLRHLCRSTRSASCSRR